MVSKEAFEVGVSREDALVLISLANSEFQFYFNCDMLIHALADSNFISKNYD